MDKTLFFNRNLLTGYGGTYYAGGPYDSYMWTYPGANDPLAPDTQPDPFAGYRQFGGGLVNRFFKMVKTAPDKWKFGKRKRNAVNILGTDWTVDANEKLTGETGATYEGATYTAKFGMLRDDLCDNGRRSTTQRRSWERQFADVQNELAGKTWLISTQEDRWYYREGRVEVADTSKGNAGELTITADCDAWKYEMFSSMDEWVWDNLDFENGVIRERDEYTFELAQNGTGSVPIFPLEKPEPVWISVSSQYESGNNVFLCWDGETIGVGYSNLNATWLKTSFIPTKERFKLNVENRSAHALTLRIYYRGAMR